MSPSALRRAAAFCAIATSSSLFAQAFSTSTTFCRIDGLSLPGCPSSWPTATCTADSGSTFCKCPAGGPAEDACVVGTPSASATTTGRCSEVIVKVLGAGSDVVDDEGLSLPDGVTAAQETYCKNMVKNDQWASYVRQSSDGPADLGNSWSAYWNCWSFMGRTWRQGRCLDSTRYVDESCWDGAWWTGNPGQCKSDDSHSEYAVSCYKEKCTMWAHVNSMERPQCSCSISGGGFAHVFFACTSDTCNGHACVLSTRDGNRYCDYSTGQTVSSWFR